MKNSERSLIIYILWTFITLFASDCLSADLGIADSLFRNGFYIEARGEYLRLMYSDFAFPDSSRKYVYKRIADTYLASNDYINGIAWCMKIELEHPEQISSSLLMTEAMLFMRAEQYENAEFSLVKNSSCDTLPSAQADFLRGCLRAKQWQLADAINFWKRIPPDSQFSHVCSEYIQITRNAQTWKFRSASTAAFLGLIPGLGYAYANHYKTALSAFIVIGLTAWGTYASFKEGIDGIGYLSGFLTIGWYVGSIYGSHEAIVRLNDFRKSEYRKQINY